MADDKQEVLNLIKELTCRLQTIPTDEPTCFPSFLTCRKPRYQLDWDKVPLITHASVVEIRPTHEMKMMKKATLGPEVTYIRINSVHNTHASPPWYHPCNPRFLREQEEREKQVKDIWPEEEINPCQMPPIDLAAKKLEGEKQLECTCSEDYPNIRICQWKDQPYMNEMEKQERFLCTGVNHKQP